MQQLSSKDAVFLCSSIRTLVNSLVCILHKVIPTVVLGLCVPLFHLDVNITIGHHHLQKTLPRNQIDLRGNSSLAHPTRT